MSFLFDENGILVYLEGSLEKTFWLKRICEHDIGVKTAHTRKSIMIEYYIVELCFQIFDFILHSALLSWFVLQELSRQDLTLQN